MMEKAGNLNNHKGKIIIIVALVVAVFVVSIVLYRAYQSTHISTDDAFVEGNIYTVAPKIPGTVKAVLVADNQRVAKGDVLVELDPVDYDVRLAEAASGYTAEQMKLRELQNRLEAARRQVEEARAVVEAARANASLRDATFRQAQVDLKRYENLYNRDAVSKERYQQVATAFEVNRAQVQAAKEQVRQAEATLASVWSQVEVAKTSLSTQEAAIKSRQAVMKGAELNRSYTRLSAPIGGYVTKKSVEVGNQVSAGTPLLAVVPLEGVWVVANYKETQLERVRPGQNVRIRVDTYPGKTFKGKVDSIMAGTGSAFSLFPPENATGNYVKVVQRLPVKIVLDRDANRDHLLRVGMSVVPTILVE